MIFRTPPTHSPDRARELAGRALDDAMHALDVSSASLGRHLGCDEAIVRRMRAGATGQPLTAAVMLRLPPTLYAEVQRRLTAYVVASPSVAPEAAGCSVQCAAAEVIAAIATAMRDGRITPDEVHRLIDPALARLDGAAASLRSSRGDA